MTREHAKEMLPIIQAYAEGKVIQYRKRFGPTDNNQWESYGFNTGFQQLFFSKNVEFRIKPEPREFWIVKRDFGSRMVYDSLPSLTQFENMIVELIHVKEVL